MASVKLVNGNPHHLHHYSLHSHHHHPHHHPPFLHHHHHHAIPLVNPPSPPPSPSTSPIAQGHPNVITATTAGMTLDYSLPNRSRLGDRDHPIEFKQNNSNIIKDVITSDNSSTTSGNGSNSRSRSHQNYSDNCDNSSNKRNASDVSNTVIKPSLPSSPQSPHSLITTGSEHPELGGIPERNSPTKKNKRKLSEPRKLRSDIDEGVGSCGDSRTSPHIEINSPAPSCSDDDSEDENHPPAIKIPKFPSQSIVSEDIKSKNSSIPKQQPTNAVSAKHKSNSSSRRNKHSNSLNNEQFSSSSTPPPSASSTSPSSSSSPYITQTHAPQPDNDSSLSHEKSSSALPNGLPPPPSILHPFLSAVPPAAFGLIPGLYLPGQPYASPALPNTFPGIPLHLQQSYFAAAAVAAAAQSAGSSPPPPPHLPPSSSSSSSAAPQPSCSSSSGKSAPSETFESSQLYKQPNPSSSSSSSSHPVILHPPQLHSHLSHLGSGKSSGSGTGKGKSPASSSRIAQQQQPQPASSSATSSHYQQISQQLHPQPPPSSRPSSSLLDNQINDDEEDDCESSSRPHSPEDLSMGGKMSRKHRKNYKNMTRERRVEANARERTRVHTISAAFDALRRAVPSYSYNQKLSKLAILRIASSYIMSLARLADLDYTSSSEHIQRPLTFAECVDMCTNTIQTEGRARRRH